MFIPTPEGIYQESTGAQVKHVGCCKMKVSPGKLYPPTHVMGIHGLEKMVSAATTEIGIQLEPTQVWGSTQVGS